MRVGARVMQVLAILDAHGPQGYRRVAEIHGGITNPAASKYCHRAVAMGLATRDDSTWPGKYAVVADWRSRAAHKSLAVRMPSNKPIPTFGAHNPWGTHA